MSTTTDGPWDELEPEEWGTADPSSLSPEAMENEPDDIIAATPSDDAGLPLEADEADVIEQRAQSSLEDDDDMGPAE